MARIPRYSASQALSVGGSFNAPNRPRAPSVAPIEVPHREVPRDNALGGMADALASFSDGLLRVNAKRRASEDSAWVSEARAKTSIDWMRQETALRQNAAPGAEGYAQGAMETFDEYRNAVLEGAPSDSAREAFQTWSDGFSTQVAGRALEFEEASIFAQRADSLNTAFEAHVQTVFADPDQYESILARAHDDLAGASVWMTPEQEIEAQRKIETSLQLARAKNLAHFEPLRFQEEIGLATGPVMGIAAKIIGNESGGDPTAKNPKSSASGLGQFTNATWVATIRKHFPDLAEVSDADLLTMKEDPEFGKQVTIRHTEDNINGLIASGLEPTEGNVYLAHFAGIEGARQVLTADGTTPIEDILGAAAVKANPFLKDMTAGDLVAWASAKMDGTTPADMGSFLDNPKYSRLSPDQIFALAKDADTAIVQQHSAALKERQAVYGARFNGLMVAIQDGQAGMADVEEARSEGWLYSYQDIKKATDAIESRDKEAIKTAQAMARFADTNETFNPFVSDDRKDIDTAYQAMGGSVGLATGDEVAVQRLRGFVERSNIVPETAVNSIQAGIRSRNPEDMAASFQVMDGLRRAYPDAVSRAFTESDLERIDAYQALVGKVPPEELYDRLDPNADPKRREFADKLRSEGRKLAGDVETSDILYAFDPGMTWSDPEGPLDPVAQVELRNDFETLFAERYAISGDEDIARDQALEALQTQAHWGLSESGSEWRVMKFPPERVYPAVGGDYDWIGDQLEAFVTGYDETAQSWSVRPVRETEAAMQAGELAPYEVVYVDADGAIRTVNGDDGRPALLTFDYDGELNDATAAALSGDQQIDAMDDQLDKQLERDAGRASQMFDPRPEYTTGGQF